MLTIDKTDILSFISLILSTLFLIAIVPPANAEEEKEHIYIKGSQGKFKVEKGKIYHWEWDKPKTESAKPQKKFPAADLKADEPQKPAPLESQDEAAEAMDETNAKASSGSAGIPYGAMLSVEGGCFQMGDVFGDSGSKNQLPVHEVCVNDFQIDVVEVTQIAFRQTMGDLSEQKTQCNNCPIENVSVEKAKAFCEKEGRRLPTEAEWEYAARSGGKDNKFSGTSDEQVLGDYAWYSLNSGGKVQPTGLKKPNGLGLFDMSGNASEWVADVWDPEYYKKSPKENPLAASGNPFYYIHRGGSSNSSDAKTLRTTYRGANMRDPALSFIGFRCAK
jgi:formylglycine-generating enzyme required for sulfatase activity